MEKSVKVYHSAVGTFRKNYAKVFIAIPVLAIIIALSVSHKESMNVIVFAGFFLVMVLLRYYGLFLHRYKIEGTIFTYRHFYDVFTFNVMSIAEKT